MKIKDLKDSNTALLAEISNLKRGRLDTGEATDRELHSLRLELTQLQQKKAKLDDAYQTCLDKSRLYQQKNELLEKKLEKAQMVLENNERQHQTEMKLAHVQGLLQGKDSSGTLPTLQQVLATPNPTCDILDTSYGSLGSSVNTSF